jgi:hypothetical protein
LSETRTTTAAPSPAFIANDPKATASSSSRTIHSGFPRTVMVNGPPCPCRRVSSSNLALLLLEASSLCLSPSSGSCGSFAPPSPPRAAAAAFSFASSAASSAFLVFSASPSKHTRIRSAGWGTASGLDEEGGTCKKMCGPPAPAPADSAPGCCCLWGWLSCLPRCRRRHRHVQASVSSCRAGCDVLAAAEGGRAASDGGVA